MTQVTFSVLPVSARHHPLLKIVRGRTIEACRRMLQIVRIDIVVSQELCSDDRATNIDWSGDQGFPSMQVDNHGQPVIRTFSAARLNDRMIDELIGLCRGVLFDGAVSELEATALLRWMEANREISQHWPANVLYRRIHSTHGRKIEKAVQLRDEGRPIHIIAEEYWAERMEGIG